MELKEDHHHYDNYSTGTISRLDGFYGEVDNQLNEMVAQQVFGKAVLDVGCGFGPLVECLRNHNFNVVGIDMLGDFIRAGQARFPKADIRHVHTTDLNFPDKSFDTLVLKDTIHHIYGESDINFFLQEARRICKNRIIILDPNPTLILKLSRLLINHVDPVCSPAQAEAALQQNGYRVVYKNFSEVIAFPLSGGYVGKPLVKKGAVGNAVLALDRRLSQLLNKIGLARFICWRYLIVADLVPNPNPNQ
jgi:ubiquinone/menaquinone biosynthesis C-methylase UbiE